MCDRLIKRVQFYLVKNMPSFFLCAFEYSGNQKVIDFFYKEFPKNISLFFLGTVNPTTVVINSALNTV